MYKRQVYDTFVGADLTIMEEAKELAEKLESGDDRFPLFTSCCPAWIRFAETRHPDILPYISTCKSPMEMFGAVLKEYYKEKDAEEEKSTISVAIMPCVAKKMEAVREEFKRDGIPDVDYVIDVYKRQRRDLCRKGITVMAIKTALQQSRNGILSRLIP